MNSLPEHLKYLVRTPSRSLTEEYIMTLHPSSSTARMKLESLYTKSGIKVLDEDHPHVLANDPRELYILTCDQERINKCLPLYAQCYKLGLIRKI